MLTYLVDYWSCSSIYTSGTSSAALALSSVEEYSTFDVMFFIIDFDGLNVVQSLLDVEATHCLARMMSLTVSVFSLFLSCFHTVYTREAALTVSISMRQRQTS